MLGSTSFPPGKSFHGSRVQFEPGAPERGWLGLNFGGYPARPVDGVSRTGFSPRLSGGFLEGGFFVCHDPS